MKRLFKQFSFPGGIPSHVAPETPGSIHEGGELGYSLSHAYGAAFDNPDLIVACVVGVRDGWKVFYSQGGTAFFHAMKPSSTLSIRCLVNMPNG